MFDYEKVNLLAKLFRLKITFLLINPGRLLTHFTIADRELI